MIAPADFGCCAHCEHWTGENDPLDLGLVKSFCPVVRDVMREDDTCPDYERREEDR